MGDFDDTGEWQVGERAADCMSAIGQQDGMEPWLQVLRRFGGVRRAMKKAPEEAVALLANGANALQHAIQWHPQKQQRM